MISEQSKAGLISPKDLAGRTAASFEMDVERGKINEFAKATLSTNPAYLTGDSPISPATFLITARTWQSPEQSVWTGVDRDLSRVLHGEQEFIFHGEPPRAGTHLIATERIDSVFEKQGKRGGAMLFTLIVVEFRDQAGTLVAESRATQITTGEPPKNES
jgi:hypothetical protein